MHSEFSVFESELQVRPDDIDLNGHVHQSKYFDYVLAARFDQMERCYGMNMQQFLDRGLTWFARKAFIEHKRPLFMGQWMVVQTAIGDPGLSSVRVDYEILRREDRKVSAKGWLEFTLVDVENGRPQKIPDDVLEKYTVRDS